MLEYNDVRGPVVNFYLIAICLLANLSIVLKYVDPDIEAPQQMTDDDTLNHPTVFSSYRVEMIVC